MHKGKNQKKAAEAETVARDDDAVRPSANDREAVAALAAQVNEVGVDVDQVFRISDAITAGVTSYARVHAVVENLKAREIRTSGGLAMKLILNPSKPLSTRARGGKAPAIPAVDYARVWNQAELCVPCMDIRVLDFYHLSEHVHEAKRIVFGEGDESGEKWAEQVLHAVKHEGYDL